ncbi:MAG: hypothetical protein IPJ65_16475 [Archangiaceae bacterium]|nr:hypothetical protein [Archangiaceae bacterium]
MPTPDGGGDDGGGNPNPVDKCSGGCAVNQVCDPDRVCRDGCRGTCDGGSFCAALDAGESYECQTVFTSCGTTACEEGQVACLGGACTCLGPARGTFDSCFGDPRFPGAGSVCGANGTCTAPKRYQQCKTDGTPCANNTTCQPVFGASLAVCTKACSAMTACDRGEICSGQGCLPSGLFNGQECAIQYDAGVVDDAGMHVLSFQTVTVGSKCLMRGTDMGGTPTEIEPSGTCNYAFFYFADQGPFTFATCRPPGGAPENGLCEADPSITAQATQCGTGLECAGMRGGTKGVCLRTCNALPPSVTYPSPQPACPMDESCINLYRREDTGHDGALLGVCTKKCNVFDAAKNSCANYGTTPAVCVPTNADGRVVVTTDGSGVCIPKRETTAALDMPCDQTDPFKGSSCGSGQVCPPAGYAVAPVCTQLCDTSCTGTNPPARCATEVNATCPTGKTCRTVTSTSGARVGFCQ